MKKETKKEPTKPAPKFQPRRVVNVKRTFGKKKDA
jgi:hypothetical protein